MTDLARVGIILAAILALWLVERRLRARGSVK